MTISTQDSKVNYQGNGQTTVFQIPFPFLENEQIYVQKKDAEGNLINYTYATDYMVTGAGEENGGSVTLNVAPEQGSTISIYRDVPLTQEVDYRENEIFPAETHEEALDKLTMEVQQIQEQLDRSFKVDRFSDVDLDIFVNAIERVYDSTDNIDTVANNINDVNTVADNIANVNTAATNMAAIQYAPTAATNAANSATASATSAQAAQDAADKVQGLIATPIGTIFQSVYVDESLDIARQLNGQVISSTKFTGFRSWLNTVQTACPNLFTTETNWQAEKTNSKLGQCGKFVVDDTAGTIRLPCVVNAQGLTDLALIGEIKSESLPNFQANLGDVFPYTETSGAVTSTKKTVGWTITAGSNLVNGDTTVNPSVTSSTYQDNAPVQQEAVQYPYYIQVATGVEETLPAIREYNINTPFFFGQSMYSDVAPDNASWLVSNGQYNAKTVYPDYYDWLLEQRNTNIKTFYKWHLTTDPYMIPFVTLTNTLSVGTTIYAYMPTFVLGEITAISGNEVTIRNDIINQTYTLSIDVANPAVSSAYLYDRSKMNVISKEELDGWDYPINTSDYDFVINTADQTFRLPLKSKLASGSAVVGNGMTLGMNDSFGIQYSSGDFPHLLPSKNVYDKPTGSAQAYDGSPVITHLSGLGVTTDPTKSGIETSSNGLNLYYYVGDTVQDASLINAGAVLGQLANVNAASRGYLVDSYHNGTEWYRIYSDGWIEQGGRFYNNANVANTISFLKPFKNTDYSLLINHGVSGKYDNSISGRHTDEAWGYTTTNFQAQTYNAVGLNWIVWSACGY